MLSTRILPTGPCQWVVMSGFKKVATVALTPDGYAVTLNHAKTSREELASVQVFIDDLEGRITE